MPRPHVWVAVTHALVAALLATGIWAALPARWWPVDVFGTALAAVCLAGAAALLSRRPWGARVARVASWCLLVAGSATVTALALAVGHLWGMYGPVGSGGALLMGAVAALITPYLVGIPALQLRWLATRP